MKKLVAFFTFFIVTGGLSLFAGSLDYLTNQSAKVCLTFHRTASTDASADIVNYNPAGTAFLEKGLYLDFSSQMLFKPYRAQASDTDPVTRKYEQNEPTWYLPNFYALYNFGNIGPGRHAVYLQMGIVAGGGTLNWPDGTIGTYAAYSNSFSSYGGVTDHSFKAYSVYYGIGVGASYSFFRDMVSFSAGVRMVIPDRSVQLSAVSGAIPIIGGNISLSGKFSYTSLGYTPILGADVRPLKGLTVGMRYEAETRLSFKYKKDYLRVDPETILIVNVYDTVEEGLAAGGLYDGNKFNYNLPHIISAGAEYDMSFLLQGLSLMTSATVYLLPVTDLGKYYDSADGTTDPLGNVNEYFGVGWEAGIGASYQVLQDLKVGMGFAYATPGTKDSYFKSSYTMLNASANPPLDSVTLGTGATYLFRSIGIDVTLAFTSTFYIPYSGTLSTAAGDFDVEYRKIVFNIATGVGYKL
ncbi:MAG: hypothetical protein CVV44_10845 [Spirochaetae bacterium HGW-Spirochaetae-1]|jgi:opacity protein-like surface antigen|nr:MAG: hypothetical protein CVV44_10845 [Spirochaetae bacterium HGW-Spirochaetae-1]